MEQTTLSKTARSAELLAASVLINEVVKDIELSETIEERTQKSAMLVAIITTTFSPAEA